MEERYRLQRKIIRYGDLYEELIAQGRDDQAFCVMEKIKLYTSVVNRPQQITLLKDEPLGDFINKILKG